jgi:hypothetical protein
VIYISADLFISPRVFSFRQPVRRGVCREFQAFAARRFAAAREKRVFQSLSWGDPGPFSARIIKTAAAAAAAKERIFRTGARSAALDDLFLGCGV